MPSDSVPSSPAPSPAPVLGPNNNNSPKSEKEKTEKRPKLSLLFDETGDASRAASSSEQKQPSDSSEKKEQTTTPEQPKEKSGDVPPPGKQPELGSQSAAGGQAPGGNKTGGRRFRTRRAPSPPKRGDQPGDGDPSSSDDDVGNNPDGGLKFQQYFQSHEHDASKPMIRLSLPSSVDDFKGDGSITLEPWFDQIYSAAQAANWSTDYIYYVMKNRLRPPAADFIGLFPPKETDTQEKLVDRLTSLYGKTQTDVLAQHQNIIRHPQLPEENFRQYLNRQMANFRTLNASDRFLLLRFSLRDEYNEELRRKDIKDFEKALVTLMDYDKTRRPAPAPVTIAAEVSEPSLPVSSINALFEQRYNRFNEVLDRLASLEANMNNLARVSQSSAPAKWCTFHKVSSHNDSECKAQKQQLSGKRQGQAQEATHKYHAKK